MERGKELFYSLLSETSPRRTGAEDRTALIERASIRAAALKSAVLDAFWFVLRCC